jgi:hypothetical protein
MLITACVWFRYTEFRNSKSSTCFVCIASKGEYDMVLTYSRLMSKM